ncbi:MAG: preprotein translocase subunit YajC [Bacteroidales bacterium]|nr:preprotein translocase subunit YajC [Candidatus Liminaster caballi]
MMNALFLQAAAQPENSGMVNILFIVGIIVVFYFFMIRPQRQQQKKIEAERNSMKVGDSVVTSSGMYGKIEGVCTATDQKGNTYVESFIIKVKPDYQTRIQISKDCVYKDLNDAVASQAK